MLGCVQYCVKHGDTWIRDDGYKLHINIADCGETQWTSSTHERNIMDLSSTLQGAKAPQNTKWIYSKQLHTVRCWSKTERTVQNQTF